MKYILFFVFLCCQLIELFAKSDHDHHKPHIADGKGSSRRQKGNEGTDFTQCSSKDSLCDTVQHFDSIESFLRTVTRRYPHTVKLNVIGRSFRHRPIYSMEIFQGSDLTETITVVVEFGIHGREWASPASAMFTILRLLEQGQNFTKTIRWFILPVLNPDGYHHSVTEDNMWKKNRSPHNHSECFGVDVNRNFNIGWELNSVSEPCKEDYAGPQPFSEIESIVLKRFIESLGPFAVDVYVSVHSCGQAILYPHGHTAKELSQWKLGRLLEAGVVMAKAMKQLRNRNYDIDVAYKYGGFRGSTADYMFDHFHIPYVYTLELGDRVYFEEYDFHHCYHPPSMRLMEYLTKECYAGLTALAAHVSATKETQKGDDILRSFNSFPATPYPIVKPTKLTLELLYDRVKSLTRKHSNVSSLLEIGKSVESRPIYAVKIQKGSAQESTIVVEFGIHARELASPASGLHLLEKLLTNSACNGLVERITWYIIPVLNPDGYKFAVETGQLWRKNRASTPYSTCIGIDLNRNFPVGWENLTGQYFQCRETYCGQRPISEPESLALKDFLDELVRNENVKAYLAVHTCAAGMFYPYGYKREKARNYEELELVGELMQSSIRMVAGMEYRVGPAYVMGLAGGGVDEWVYDTYHIPLVYTFELGGSGHWGHHCFFPSPADTDRLAREFFAGVESLASYLTPDALSKDDKILCYNISKTTVETATESVPNRATSIRRPLIS